MTCGITVAPRMAVASSTESVPSKPGMKPCAARADVEPMRSVS